MRTLWLLILALFCTPDKMCDGAVEIDRHSFNNLLKAIATVESNNDPNAYNADENAAGLYQIRPILLKDCNRILRKPRFKLADRFDPVKSGYIASIYLGHYGAGKSIEQLARIWNGGPLGYKKKSTKKYWEKVKKVMEALENVR